MGNRGFAWGVTNAVVFGAGLACVGVGFVDLAIEVSLHGCNGWCGLSIGIAAYLLGGVTLACALGLWACVSFNRSKGWGPPVVVALIHGVLFLAAGSLYLQADDGPIRGVFGAVAGVCGALAAWSVAVARQASHTRAKVTA